MSRLPAVTRDALTVEDQEIWDRIAAVRTGVRGPHGVLMSVPGLAERVAVLENYFRFSAALPAVDRELVILAMARENETHFPWTLHEARANQAGTRREAIEAVRANGELAELTPREWLLVEIMRNLLRTRSLPDELFSRGMVELGQQQLVETIALMGHSNLIGMVVNGFDVATPDGSVTF
jgi:4-carboxymuconolactone decarboxylase